LLAPDARERAVDRSLMILHDVWEM
jgi:hypothetical protein